MSDRRTERLLNLVICLLATRRWLTKEQIRAAIPQYQLSESTEAFDRMFERDKEDLRELGVPVETGSDSAWFEDELGYRIDRAAYALPEIDLSADELAVLGLAGRVWQQASLAGPAARALVKLRALGVATEEDTLVGVEPRVHTVEPSFEPLYQATVAKAPVRFSYRKPDGTASERTLEPWAVLSRGGRWYVVGHDRDRAAARAFRLSRVEGAVRRAGPAGSVHVPAGVDPRSLVAAGPDRDDRRTAVLAVQPGRGGFVRRRGRTVEPGKGASVPAGWDEIHVEIGDVEALAMEIAGYGDGVVVVEPADLQQAVVRRIQAAFAAQGAVTTPDTPPTAAPRRRRRGAGREERRS